MPYPTKYIPYIFEYHSVCPLVGAGTLPVPLPSLASECAPPPQTKGGGTHSPAGEGVGESQFRRLEKKHSTLPTLCLTLIDSGEQVDRSCGGPDRHAGDILSLAYHAGRLYTAGDDGLIKVHKTSLLVICTALLMYCTHNCLVNTEISLFHRNS